MPYVIEDMGSGNFDLTVTTSANWTTHTADLPNGDNAMSLVTALNQNAFWPGEEFCLPNGVSTEARTLEFWLKCSLQTSQRTVAAVRTNSTANTTVNQHWEVYESTGENLVAVWYNTAGSTAYLQATGGVMSAGWHHIVVIFNCGSTRSIEVYLDTVLGTPDTTTTGTATYATDAAYEFYLGAARTNNTNEMTDHLAKVAWYSRALDSTEISDHYLAMTAS